MKAALRNFILLVVAVPMLSVVASGQVAGTWSGTWTPKGGVPDAVTVEFKQDAKGVVTGRFLTPAPMQFGKVSYDAKTRALLVEAADSKSGKHYKLEGKVEGTEIKGRLQANDVAGDLLLIKWTYVPR